MMASRTAFLSKLIGLYCIVGGLAMLTNKQGWLDTVAELLRNGPTLLIVGVITVAAGLAMIVGHNVWSGGVLPVVITIIGWLTLIKGLLFMYLTPTIAGGLFLGKLSYGKHFYEYVVASLILGLYLTVAGFVAKAE
jgi:hypothetical protein